MALFDEGNIVSNIFLYPPDFYLVLHGLRCRNGLILVLTYHAVFIEVAPDLGGQALCSIVWSIHRDDGGVHQTRQVGADCL